MNGHVRFLPPGLIAVAIVVFVAGVALAVAWTPLLGVHQGGVLTALGAPVYRWDGFSWGPGALALKGLAGLWFMAHAVLILRGDGPALQRLVVSLGAVGLGCPLVLSFETVRIEPFFVGVLRFTVFAASAGLLWYLTRPAVVTVIGEGGVPATRRYRYCPICGSHSFGSGEARCASCDDVLLDRWDTAAGLVFGHAVDGLAAPQDGASAAGGPPHAGA